MSRYVLITPAWNEEAWIGETIRSVIAQTRRPEQWVIVSDGSTDRTDAIAAEHAAQHPFIRLLRIEENAGRSFACQVNATNAGYAALAGMAFDYVGILDADIRLAPDYYERLLERCDREPRLGIAGGAVIDVENGKPVASRSGSEDHHVAGGVQFFRRKCYEEIGGYAPMPHGGQDVVAEVAARTKGWDVSTFPEMEAHHLKTTVSGRPWIRARLMDGRRNHALGTHPFYQFARCFRARPLGPCVAMIGYCIAWLRREPRSVSTEFMQDLRREQMRRIKDRMTRLNTRENNPHDP